MIPLVFLEMRFKRLIALAGNNLQYHGEACAKFEIFNFHCNRYAGFGFFLSFIPFTEAFKARLTFATAYDELKNKLEDDFKGDSHWGIRPKHALSNNLIVLLVLSTLWEVLHELSKTFEYYLAYIYDNWNYSVKYEHGETDYYEFDYDLDRKEQETKGFFNNLVIFTAYFFRIILNPARILRGLCFLLEWLLEVMSDTMLNKDFLKRTRAVLYGIFFLSINIPIKLAKYLIDKVIDLLILLLVRPIVHFFSCLLQTPSVKYSATVNEFNCLVDACISKLAPTDEICIYQVSETSFVDYKFWTEITPEQLKALFISRVFENLHNAHSKKENCLKEKKAEIEKLIEQLKTCEQQSPIVQPFLQICKAAPLNLQVHKISYEGTPEARGLPQFNQLMQIFEKVINKLPADVHYSCDVSETVYYYATPETLREECDFSKNELSRILKFCLILYVFENQPFFPIQSWISPEANAKRAYHGRYNTSLKEKNRARDKLYMKKCKNPMWRYTNYFDDNLAKIKSLTVKLAALDATKETVQLQDIKAVFKTEYSSKAPEEEKDSSHQRQQQRSSSSPKPKKAWEETPRQAPRVPETKMPTNRAEAVAVLSQELMAASQNEQFVENHFGKIFKTIAFFRHSDKTKDDDEQMKRLNAANEILLKTTPKPQQVHNGKKA